MPNFSILRFRIVATLAAAILITASFASAQQLTPVGAKPNPLRTEEFHWCANHVHHEETKKSDWQRFREKNPVSKVGPTPRGMTTIVESEPNNTPQDADFVPINTDPGQIDSAGVLGTFVNPVISTTNIAQFETNDTIGTANPTGLVGGSSGRVQATGFIGDGGFAAQGDFDFFAIPMNAGDFLNVTVDTVNPGATSDGDPLIGLYNSSGQLVAFNDDRDFPNNFDPALGFIPNGTDTFYLAVGGFSFFSVPGDLPTNPFVGGTGNVPFDNGNYTLTIELNAVDFEYFAIIANKGDVISAAIAGAGSLMVLDDGTGTRLISQIDSSGFQPGNFPSGNASFSYVAPSDAIYTIGIPGINGNGSWSMDIDLFRPGLESQPVANRQVVFLDFDGATLNNSIFGASPSSNVTLSPLSAFLTRWGLTAQDENRLIDEIIAVVDENLNNDMRTLANNGDFNSSGIPGEFAIQILNSRDHPDFFISGGTNVSRVIIGGTIDELGISTIGIAESIDPGNFATEESAVVLLDLLSETASDPNSLNQYGINNISKIDLVARGVGNITAHEIGHFIGNWHTVNSNGNLNIMDQGGNLSNSVGVGPDNVLGTGDDIDVDFISDFYEPGELYSGVEDCLNTSAFGLSTGKAPGAYRDLLTNDLYYSGGSGDDNITITPGLGAKDVVINDNGLTTFNNQNFSNVGGMVALMGFEGNDSLNITPSQNIGFLVNGDGGAGSGFNDTITVDAQSVEATTAASIPDGAVAVANAAGVTYEGMETVNVTNINSIGPATPVVLTDRTGSGSGPGGLPAGGDPDWYFRDWRDTTGGTALEDILEDPFGTSSAAGFSITGAGDPFRFNGVGASFGQWVLPGSDAARFQAGKTYSQRSLISMNASKQSSEALRLGSQENVHSSINQTYVVNAPSTVNFGSGDRAHPFLPTLGCTRAFYNTVDPLDADLAGFNDGNPANNLFYLQTFEFINNIAVAAKTATMANFDILEFDTSTFTQNETLNPGGGQFGGTTGGRFDGSDNGSYDGWRVISQTPIPLNGGGQLLVDAFGSMVFPEKIDVFMAGQNPVTNAFAVEFTEYASFAGDADVGDGASDLNLVEVTADGSYRTDYTLQGNTNNGVGDSIPDFRMRVAYPIPTFSIEFVVNPKRGTAFPAENTPTTTAPFLYGATTVLRQRRTAASWPGKRSADGIWSAEF